MSSKYGRGEGGDFVFFFQAEDGIRDWSVTGVQTCALPISSRDDLVIYLARATVFNGKVRIQGLGTEAERYGGRLVQYAKERRLQLRYGDWDCENVPVEEIDYKVRGSGL